MNFYVPLLVTAMLVTPVWADEATDDVADDVIVGNAENGEKVFKKCKACHKIGEGAKNATGPLLNDVIGRAAGSVEGFKYSKSMIAAGEAGLIWTEETIADFTENPKEYLKMVLEGTSVKTRMVVKLKKEGDRADVAAYVATFSTPVVVEGEETETEQDASD
jgi:S-disulfanyl-L-cysteine oxidoreductase SoxD